MESSKAGCFSSKRVCPVMTSSLSCVADHASRMRANGSENAGAGGAWLTAPSGSWCDHLGDFLFAQDRQLQIEQFAALGKAIVSALRGEDQYDQIEGR